MRTLPKPALDAGAVFGACISRVKNKELKAVLTSATKYVSEAAQAYDSAAAKAELHTIKQHVTVGPQVTGEQMRAVYELRMAKRASGGREVYDSLQAAAPHGICPLCGQRTVSTLDHHLPQSRFPSLAVVPANLVPACHECNKSKHDRAPSCAEEQTLHPYYDDVGARVWLRAVVQQGVPPSLVFVIERSPDWDDITDARVRQHFETFKLASLYASHAGEELLNIQHQMRRLWGASGKSGVRAHLEELAESRAANQANSWQSAMYRALALSGWYCDGGFG